MTGDTEGVGAGDATPAKAPVAYARTNRGVATITLDDPDARNVLNDRSLPLLLEVFQDAMADDSVRVIVLTGTGTTFCAGADLRAAASGGSFGSGSPASLARLLALMLDGPKPVIARVQGHVAGGGNGLVAAADLAVAVDSARFAFSEVRVGVAPAVISTVCLRRMPPAAASELFLTGERVSAERAREAGLLHRVVPQGELDAAVAAWSDQLLLGGPQALAATKQLLRRVPEMSRDDGFAWTAELSAERFASAEAAEGMAAFAARRTPAWGLKSGAV